MALLRRPARPAESALALARVRCALPALAPSGWVLPEAEAEVEAGVEAGAAGEGQAPAAPEPAVEPVVPAAGDRPSGRHRAGRRARSTLGDVRVVPRPAITWTPPPSEAVVLPQTDAARLPSEQPDAAPLVSPAATAEPSLLPTLRERLAAGRLDPGRRAAVGLAVVGLLACLLAGLLVLRSQPQEVVLPSVEVAGRAVEGSALPSAGPAAGEVVVAVAGEVRRPGLVRLPPGSRVDDALRAAGGLQPGVAVGLLNLARRVVDGEQVVVGADAPGAAPGAGPGAAQAGGGAGSAAGSGLVDLNTAGVADLDRLPGIGPVLAQRILDHRTASGPFRSVDQLREVTGIGEAKYASLKDAVTV